MEKIEQLKRWSAEREKMESEGEKDEMGGKRKMERRRGSESK